MEKYTLKPVKTTKDVAAFHRLPFELYAGDLRWVPQIQQEVEAVFDPSQNKYFTHGCCERWLLYDAHAKVIGRIAAFINYKKANTFKQPTGGIGFFECVNEQEAANYLFDHAKKWLQAQGMEAMDGPINFGENNKFWGLLISDFDFPTYYGQNYNPPYYKTLFEQYGFQVYYYQLVNYRRINDPLPLKYRTKAEAVLADPAYSIQPLSVKELTKFAEDFRTVYNAAWVTHDNFKPMTKEMANSIFKKMKPIIDERLVCFVYHHNQAVAFCLCIPDLNPVFKRLSGQLNLLGKLKFLLFKQLIAISRVNGVAIGVHPDFQKRGIEGAIFTDLANRLQGKSKYHDVVVTWVGDFNPKMQYIFEDIGFTVAARMATYRYLFDRSAVFERSPIIEK
jgi:GNAT superfamily N-acetyltransferase